MWQTSFMLATDVERTLPQDRFIKKYKMEDKSITPKDLMIGDWVKIPVGEVDGEKTSGGIGQVVSINNGHGCIVRTDKGYTISLEYSMLAGIPLTDEILKIVGFHDNEFGDFLLYSTVAETSIVLSPSCRRGWWWAVFGARIVRLSYVHQLQNIMHVCKFEEEVKL